MTEVPAEWEAEAEAVQSGIDELEQVLTVAPEGADLATRYEPGTDMVETPDGTGLVVETITSTREIDAETDTVPEQVDASDDSPTYVVTLPEQDPPIGLYKASDLELADVNPDVDPIGSLAEDEKAAEALADGDCPECEGASLGDWNPPESWRESDTPARVIALDAFASMGGDFDGCEREMRGQVGQPDQFCAAFMDYLYGGYDYWRGDSFLPGD